MSLLDIHVADPSESCNGPSLEILEAGTGHGALTLHLARAIHAANVAPSSSQGSQDGSNMQDAEDLRQAVIHTVELSPGYSEHAKKVVQGFRQGLYNNDVDFHIGNVSDWIDQQIEHRKAQGKEQSDFLAHAILDMPRSYEHVAKVASVLRAQGCLAIFNPSITQVTAVVDTIRRERLPVCLDRVVELGPNMTGGKEWDIRAVRPRVLAQPGHANQNGSRSMDSTQENAVGGAVQETENGGQESSVDDGAVSGPRAEGDHGFEMICRPKAYARVVGGGFLGVWRKKSPRGD